MRVLICVNKLLVDEPGLVLGGSLLGIFRQKSLCFMLYLERRNLGIRKRVKCY